MDPNKYTDEFFKQYEEKYIPRTDKNTSSIAKHSVKRNKFTFKKLGIASVAVLCVAILVITGVGLIQKPQPVTVQPENNVAESVPDEPQIELFKPTENADTVYSFDKMDSEYAIIVDIDSGNVIYEKNPDTKIFPASLTKVLTLLVAVENISDLNDTFTMSYEITDPHFKEGASMAGFTDGEIIPLTDLLYGLILPSGAECATAIANYVAGSEAEFAVLMNKKVEQLGITTSHFCNPSGLHHNEQYCTVRDMVIILKAAMENKLCREILSTYQYTTTSTNKHPEGILLTSTLFSRMYGTEPKNGAVIKGGKTGFTNEAGNCIASFGEATDGTNYIMVTTKAKGFWKSVFDHIEGYEQFAN